MGQRTRRPTPYDSGVMEELVPAITARVNELAAQPPTTAESGGVAARAEHLRKLGVALLVNGRQRLREAHLEDALPRAYRILELVGQMRLFERGYDAARLPPDDEHVQRALNLLEQKKKESFFWDETNSCYLAPRMPATYLLTCLGGPMGKRLSQEADKGALPPRLRNRSILIHGFQASATSRTDAEKLFHGMGDLLAEALGDDWTRLEPIAQSLEDPGAV